MHLVRSETMWKTPGSEVVARAALGVAQDRKGRALLT
jgi:hypothetical protein